MEAESCPARFADRRPSENVQFPAGGHGFPGRIPDFEKIYAGMQNNYQNFPGVRPMLKMPLENRLDKPDRELMTSWRPPYTPNLHLYHPDAALASLLYNGGYGQMGFGDRGPRRNATRETTATLKSWLNEHRKNPYPTKAEKIMLAIISKMTLTQVSTWFANARRRLKKENRMTWLPRNPSKEESDDEERAEEEGKSKDLNSPSGALHNYYVNANKRGDDNEHNEIKHLAAASSSKDANNNVSEDALKEKQQQMLRHFPMTPRNAMVEKYHQQLQMYSQMSGAASYPLTPTIDLDRNRRRDSVTSPSTSACSYDRSPSPLSAFVCLPPHKQTSSNQAMPKEFSTKRSKSETESLEKKVDHKIDVKLEEKSTKKQTIWSPIDITSSSDTPKSSSKRNSYDGFPEPNKSNPMYRERQASFTSPFHQETRDSPFQRVRNVPPPNRHFFPPNADLSPYRMLTSPTKHQHRMAMAWVCLEEYNRQLLANRGVRSSIPGRSLLCHSPDEGRVDEVKEDKDGELNIDENEVTHSTDSEDTNCNIPMNLSKSNIDDNKLDHHDNAQRPFDDVEHKQRICSIVAN